MFELHTDRIRLALRLERNFSSSLHHLSISHIYYINDNFWLYSQMSFYKITVANNYSIV